MKKLIAFVLAVVMTFGLTAYASASFVNSPSYNPDPVVDSATNGDCNGHLIVTPYRQRYNGSLNSAEIRKLETAYFTISHAYKITSLNSGLANLGVPAENLGVSALFDVKCTIPCSGPYTVQLTSETFKNFVALLHYVDGNWEIVENASANGTTLTFTVNSLSPFAVVVNTKGTGSGDVVDVVPPQELNVQAAVEE